MCLSLFDLGMLVFYFSYLYYPLGMLTLSRKKKEKISTMKWIHRGIRRASSLQKPIQPNTEYKPNSMLTQLAKGVIALGTDTANTLGLWMTSAEPITTRREIMTTLRVQKTWIRIPFTVVYLLLPFTLPTLPFVIRFFPSILPSYFHTAKTQEWKLQARWNQQRKAALQVQDMISQHPSLDQVWKRLVIPSKTQKTQDVMAWYELIPHLKSFRIKDIPQAHVLVGISPFLGILL
jgi:hypothetical protein